MGMAYSILRYTSVYTISTRVFSISHDVRTLIQAAGS